MAGRDQQSGLAIGREVHVARQKRLAEGAAHRLLAHVLHVERRLALPLRHQHARVEGAQCHHVAQAGQQRLIAQETGPGADRLPVAVEHADDGIGEIADGFRIGVHRWAATEPARGICTLEKSGVPPGRTAGSGTCSCSGPYPVICLPCSPRPVSFAVPVAEPFGRDRRRRLPLVLLQIPLTVNT